MKDTLKLLRKATVRLHVDSLSEENVADMDVMLQDKEGHIINLLNDLYTLCPALGSDDDNKKPLDWLKKLCQRQGGLGQATQTLSAIRKQIAFASQPVNQQPSPSRKEMTVSTTSTPAMRDVPAALSPTPTPTPHDAVSIEQNASSPKPPPTIHATPIPIPIPIPAMLSSSKPSTISTMSTTFTTAAASIALTAPTITTVLPPPCLPSPPLMKSLEELRHAEACRLDLFRKRATIAAEVEEKQIEHIMQASLRGISSQSDSYTPYYSRTTEHFSEETTSFSGLESIASTPLKAYRPPLFPQVPPPTPTPEIGIRVPMPSAYPDYPPPTQPLNSIDNKQDQLVIQHEHESAEVVYRGLDIAGNDNRTLAAQWNTHPMETNSILDVVNHQRSFYGDTSEINFGLESQLSDVMPEYSTLHQTIDSVLAADKMLPLAQDEQQQYTSATTFLAELEHSNASDTTMKTNTSTTINTTAIETEYRKHSKISQEKASWTASGSSEVLSNRTWAQQVVAQQQQDERAAKNTKEYGMHNDSVADYAERESTIEAASFDHTKDTMSTSDLSHTLDDIPAESLQKMARCRDPDAGLVLASRRARKKVRKENRLKSQKEAERKAKKERLQALNREVSLRRERAVTHKKYAAAASRRPKSHKKKRKGGHGSNGSSVSSGSGRKNLLRSDLKQIEEARRRTIKRLREKQQKLKYEEVERQQKELDLANEKWRLRDAKLAVDRQRRIQRQRFVESKRSALSERQTNYQQHRRKKKPLTSILKSRKENSGTCSGSRSKSSSSRSSRNVGSASGVKVAFVPAPQPPTETWTIPTDLNSDSVEGDMADVSAVYEDVEAWVKSVYGSDDENVEKMHPTTATNFSEGHYFEQSDDRQQAEEDDAFLDAIMNEN